jgi:hypothetical protein
MSERRNESRYLCADLVRVDWVADGATDEEDIFRTEEAVLEDISEVGGCVQTEITIPLGATIMLSIHGAKFMGNVCYCVFRDYGYFVGIRFSDETVWSAETVIPDHLTNLQELASQASD